MKHILIKFFALLFITLALVVLIFFVVYKGIYNPKDSNLQEETYFTVEKGQGVKEIAGNLEEQGLIKDKWYFVIYVVWQDIALEIKAGDYLISPSMTVSEIAEKLFLGDVARERVVIFEGWNLRDIATFFEEKETFTKDEFFEIAGYPSTNLKPSGFPFTEEFDQEFDFLADKPRTLSMEGYLFPDTYEIYKNDRAGDIIRRMLTNFGEQLTQEIRDEIEAQGKTIFEIVIVASIIEKEVNNMADKKIVSGIIWKRLEIDKPLQIDATVNYFTEESRRQVLISQTEIDSPYNTYMYKGLPLGPISNPGMNSIIAAINPTKTSYLYYLNTKSGQTIFSQTFEQHKAAKAKYLQ